jgi:hypothetical protein
MGFVHYGYLLICHTGTSFTAAPRTLSFSLIFAIINCQNQSKKRQKLPCLENLKSQVASYRQPDALVQPAWFRGYIHWLRAIDLDWMEIKYLRKALRKFKIIVIGAAGGNGKV